MSDSTDIGQNNQAGGSGTLPSSGSTPSATVVMDIPLASVVSNARIAKHDSADVFRRYVGTVTSKMTLNDRPDVCTKRNVFQVGARDYANPEALLDTPDPLVMSYTQNFMLRSELSSEINGIVNKYSNFSANFTYMDLSALASQLAKGLAVFAQCQLLSDAQLGADTEFDVRALSTLDDPVTAPAGGLFIPRKVDELCPGVFAALVRAANAYGVVPYTDILMLDGNGKIKVHVPQDASLALACAQGIRYLLAQANECGAGAIISYATVCGIHDVVSVVAHSDEGGYMRDVFRRGQFCAPYGAVISSAARGFMGLPIPSVSHHASFVALVDSIAIASAALTAVCDPMIKYDGKYYPTVSSYQGGSFAAPGANTALTGTDVLSAQLWHANNIGAICGTFCHIYVRELAKLFVVSGGESVAADCHMARFNDYDENGSRHLAFRSVAPYYWIEPTGMFKSMPETDACKMGYGPIAPVGLKVEKPCFEDIVLMQGGQRSTAAISFRSLRTNGLMLHLAGNPRNGLSAIVPIQFLSDRMANIGGSNTATSNRTNGRGMDSYMWGKAQTLFPHPAEMLYTGASMGVQIVHDAYDAALALRRNHVPTADELVEGTVSFTVGRLSAAPPGKLGHVDSGVRRERSRAIEALASTARDVSRTVNTGGETIAVGEFEPLTVFPDPTHLTGASLPGTTPVVARGLVLERTGATPDPVYQHAPRSLMRQQQNAPRRGTGGGNRLNAPDTPQPSSGTDATNSSLSTPTGMSDLVGQQAQLDNNNNANLGNQGDGAEPAPVGV